MLFGVLLSTLVYKYIILKRKKGYYTTFIITYAIVIPICISFPFVLIEVFDVRNALLRFCLTLTPITSMFRSMEGKLMLLIIIPHIQIQMHIFIQHPIQKHIVCMDPNSTLRLLSTSSRIIDVKLHVLQFNNDDYQI